MKISYYSLVLLFSLALWGCSSSNSSAPPVIDTTTGKHAAGWAVNGAGGAHPFAYFANSISCEECHGKPSDPAGGISRVSCSNPGRSGVVCHPSFPHVPGFAAYAKHGSAAKDVASGVTGMAHCKQCHGSSYTGAGLAPSCIDCHKETTPSSNAPHAANWVSGNANGLRHSSTVENNAPACAQCHLGGTYSHVPPVPAPAGTAPGCYNGTLCHNNAGHTFTWPTHMAPASSSLAGCQSCHATPATGNNPRFNLSKGSGVLNPNGCEGCHNRAGIAHPYMWLPGRGTTQTPSGPVTNSSSHANAGTVNASCGLCHGGTPLAGGGSAPSCFPASSINGTTCHFTKPVDSQGSDIGCGSCHGAIPQVAPNGLPNGTVAPNRDFRHKAHFTNISALALSPDPCQACHYGLGTGKSTHATSMTASIVIGPLFNGNGVTASYDSTTKKCSNVSCHGKFTDSLGNPLTSSPFPAWDSSTFFNPFNCVYCHTVSLLPPPLPTATVPPVPYIGPYSGTSANFANLHGAHVAFLGYATSCLECHAIPGKSHWADIMQGNRVLPRGFAKNTVGGPTTSVTSYIYDSTTGTSTCITALGCHTIAPPDPRSWYQ